MEHGVVVVPEAALLADALDVAVGRIRLLSREPYGDGSIAGFTMTEDDGAESIIYVDTSGVPVMQETGLALDGVARIWTHPADPHVRALPVVAFEESLAVLLGRLGTAAVGPVEMVTYRAGRRAVLRVPAVGETLWLKVVRPRHAERIADLHTAFAAGGVPVPQVRAWSPDGLLIIASAAGDPATAHVQTDDQAHGDDQARAQSFVDAVDDLRARIAAVSLTTPARADMPARADWYSRRIALHSDVHARRIAQIDRGVVALLADAQPASAAIHGDLHTAQLFVDSHGSVSGVIDVDTAGVGDPAEDAAAFISHAAASALIAPAAFGASAMSTLATCANERWGHDGAVAARLAIQLVGHAAQALDRGDEACVERMLTAAESALNGRFHVEV